MNRKSYLSLICIISICITTQISLAQGFEVTDPGKGTIVHNTEVIIEKVRFEMTRFGTAFAQSNGKRAGGIYPDSSQFLSAQPDHVFSPSSEDWKGAVAYGETAIGFPWAREMAVNINRDTAEISHSIIITPAVRNDTANIAHLQYFFPVKALKGSKYTVSQGSSRSRLRESDRTRSGIITGEEKNNEYIAKGAIWMQIQRDDGFDFMVDLQPTGPWGLFEENPANGTAFWQLVRSGDYYVLDTYTYQTGEGDKFSRKMVLRTGNFAFDDIHPIDFLSYTWRMPTTWRIQFTEGKPVKGFKSYFWSNNDYSPQGYAGFSTASSQLYSKGSGQGWINRPEGKIQPSNSESDMGPLYSGGFAARGKGTYVLKQRNAMVLTNILFSGASGKAHVKVRANNGNWTTVDIPSNERRIVTIPQYVKNGNISIDIEGDKWLLSGIIVQPLFFENEDYLFSRSWWAFGREPWNWPQFTQKKSWRLWPDGQFGPKTLPMNVIIGQ